MLPTFIVIGAMKCGTTSLYYYLADHPEICMSAVKETDFFIAEKNFARRLEWYRSLFRGTGSARGECSPNYAKCHLFEGVPGRIYESIPEVKLIYLVRDPLQRTVSHYLGSRAQGREERSLDAALRDVEHSNYVLTSRYYRQLRPYLEYFDRQRLLVVTTEQLQEDVHRTLRKIYRFVSVDETHQCQWAGRAFNASATKKAQPTWFRWISRRLLSQRFKDWVRPYVAPQWMPGQLLDRPELAPDLRDRLTAHFRPDVEALRAVTQQSFASWSL